MHIIELQSASKMVFEVAQDLRRTKNNAFLVECENHRVLIMTKKI